MKSADHRTRLPCGKLPAAMLRGLLQQHAPRDARVVVGPGVGLDAAVIEMGDRYLVAKSDPVTLATDEIGRYAVHVNANDVACCGATPRWFLATLLLPEKSSTTELAEQIFTQVSEACRQLGVSLCGGHTEITHGLDRPIVVGHMLGEVAPKRLVTAAGARPGDVLLVTKSIALEGTSLLARERPDEFAGVLSADELAGCRELLRSPGISVVAEARAALDAGGVHALHDPTEGGLATGLHELAEASHVGLYVERARVPVLPECEKMCRHLRIDPWGLIASGSLLIAAAPEHATGIVERLAVEGLAATEIGRVVPAGEGRAVCDAAGRLSPLPTFARDELARVLGA